MQIEADRQKNRNKQNRVEKEGKKRQLHRKSQSETKWQRGKEILALTIPRRAFQRQKNTNVVV